MRRHRRAATVLGAVLIPLALGGACSKRAQSPESGPGANAVQAPPQPHGTTAEANQMLAKAAPYVKSVGREQAFSDFTARKPPFFYRDLYMVCVDANQVVVAHGGFPTYVGSGFFFKDMDGKVVAPEIWKTAAKGEGTLRYTLRDDETNNVVERKVGFFRRIGNDVCGVVAHEG